ncbi:MAG: TonB-dependent receptor [Desulfobulbus sp.]
MREKNKSCTTALAAVMVCTGTLIVPCRAALAASDTPADKSVQKVENHQAVEGGTVMLPSLWVEEQAIKADPNVVGRDGLDMYGGAAQLNPYAAISMLPGVDIRYGDAYGMSISHRIRGKADRNIGETMEGLPLKGIGPGGGLSTMMDLENLESITVEKGAVDVDSGLGYGSDNGMIDMHILQPKETPGLFAKQAFGSEDFQRSFLRVDTGTLKDIAKLFVSASYTDAEKWKGAGDSPDGRKNGAFGLASPDDHKVKWSIDGVYNKQKSYNYRSLTYEQSKDLSRYYNYDYNETLTGIPSQDSVYYGYNYSDFSTWTLIGKLQVPVSLLGDGVLTFKPYYLHDEGNSYSGSGTTVTDWLVEHETFGGVLEYEQKIGIADIKMGYWYGEDEPPGPPTSRKTRTINADGTLSFKSWERLVGVTDNTHFNSPFIGSTFQFDRFSINTGIRYLWWTTPSLTFYDTKGIGDVSYEQALSQATKENFHVDGETYGVFLPKIGGNYRLTDTLSLNGSYGRNYNTPQYSIGSALLNYSKKGKTEAELQDIWTNRIKPEESDNFDFGVKFDRGRFTWDTTLFYSLTKNTAGTYYDTYLDETYIQNAGESQSYGVEMAFGYQILEGLQANLALTYNRNEFTEDFLAADGVTTINAKGNQIPEVPEFMANMSLLWEIGDFSICPRVRYLGPRYADVENKYDMDEFYLVDLDIAWKLVSEKNHAITLKVAATNLLDKEYVAKSSAGDQTTEISGLSFTVGAPRTVFALIQFEM